jgi:hypothetical protein
VGPIQGRVRETTKVKSRDTTASVVRDATILEAVLGSTTRMSEFLSNFSTHGFEQRQRLRQRLVTVHGMTSPAATKILTCLVDDTRIAVWDLLHDRTPTTVDAAFAAHLKRCYLDEPAASVHAWWVTATAREQAAQFLLARDGRVRGCTSRAELRREGLRESLLGPLTMGDRPFLLRDHDGDPPGKCCGRSTCSRNDQYTLQPCPHCGNWASLSLLVPEVPAGVLCPDCRRVPTFDSVVFPEEYALLTPDIVLERLRIICPDVLNSRGQYAIRIGKAEQQPSNPVDAAAFTQWASANAIPYKRTQPIPARLLQVWRDDVARRASIQPDAPSPRDRTPRTVRAWAYETGLHLAAGGRLPAAVWAAFDNEHPHLRGVA